MSYNRELVVYYINYKLSQRNYPLNHMGLIEPPNRTDGGGAGLGEEQRVATHANGTFNGMSPTTPPASPQRQQPLTTTLDAVKEALRDSANEFELRYARAFNDLHNQLHITPATAYQSFENVMDEVFRDGVNWGRIVGLFAFGGALCVECVEKEMSQLVGRIIEWMTVYLDNHIQPWIQSQGGWANGNFHMLCGLCQSYGHPAVGGSAAACVSDPETFAEGNPPDSVSQLVTFLNEEFQRIPERFAEIFGQDAAAESRRSQESFKKWLLAGMTLVTGVVVGSLIARQRL